MKKKIKNILKINFNNLVKSSFFRNSSYMVLGTIAMQMIAIATIPLLTRMFEPETFGFHATYRSTLVILSIVLTLKLETAIVLPKDEKEKNYIYITSIINSLLVLTLLIITYYVLKELFNIDLLYLVFKMSNFELLLFVTLGSLLVSLTNININALVSLKEFKKIAFSRLILPSSFFVISIFLFYTYKTKISLVISQFTAYILLFIYLQKNVKFHFNQITKEIYVKILNKYKEIIKYTSLNSLLNTISVNIPSLILLSLFGARLLGFYAIGAKLISLPTQIVSSSFSQVFYKKAVDIYNNNRYEFYPFVKKVMFSLLSLGTLVFTILYFIIPTIVPYFLGNEWKDATKIMQYLCLWQALAIVNGPVSAITIILNKQKSLLVYQILLLIFRVLSIWYSFHLGLSGKYSILAYALVGLSFNFFLFIYFLHISKTTVKNDL